MSDTPSTRTSGPASAGSLFDMIATGVRFVAGLALIVLVLLVSAEIVSRFFFNHSLRVVEELAGYLVVGLTLFGASLAVRKNSLFQVGFIFDALPGAVKRVMGLVYLGLSLAICAVLIWYTLQLVLSSFSRGNVAPTFLMTPLWMPQLLMPLGLAFIAIFIIERMMLTLRHGETD
ncbi:TRAP-type C4-dicarboxylate transport system, small permease component [Kushneria avicenniae]|uniref:TRAP transporter small permease protein n=1 Tax=Kushneria avicenniae TaxID=402385 RepID=A0A1I1GA86_9GAMM|nr:TRAP transporter small permease [Kushneria avicenniae]SFC06243.1 TRAP-type C4-dicarboxylate transport system, small permease component [Kushneria avicenniae]